ncbi:E3 ubiquitin-protein ligase TRIM33-like [Patiria miniata]|uniref:Uncharacterized protein n=1 Tax=Patiria miniata TaxID=46514 RepID=A0A914A854_PATMI|nr:E3 ubiquitin-protein ligase TRIM33-like [Patiria miniata]
MATGGTAEVLGKISQDHLQCAICLSRYNEPKLLDCIHSFCLNCLQHHRESEGPNAMKIMCPLCRQETTLSRNSVEDLPTNLSLSALVEEFSIQEQLLEGQESQIQCQSCDDENWAISFCMECAHFMCQDCHKAHARLAVTKSHKTFTMAQLQKRKISYKSKLREEPKCGKHANQNLNIFCNTCQQTMCITCSILKHQKHSFADLSEAFNKCKQEIAKLLTKAEKKKTALSNAKKMTVKSRKKLEFMFETTNKKISQKADKEVARIRAWEQKIKKEAKEIYEDRVKTFETTENTNNEELKVAEQTLDEVNKIMTEEIQTQILDLKRKLLHNLKELMEKQPENVPYQFHFIDFHEGDEKSLGRLVLKYDWRLETEVKQDMAKDIISVAVFSNNEIVTVDNRHKELVTHSPTSNPQSPFISQKLRMPDLRDPHQVAVNRLDQLIVLDGPVVKTFSREYELLHQFQPGRGSDSKPTCLAVDDNNLIAVGYQAKQEISLHKPDGTLLKKLPAPMIAFQLTISNKRFIYINGLKEKMVALHYTGGQLFEVDTTSPKSICCDNQHGNIYVAEGEFSLPNTTDIHVFSSNGKSIGCIIKQSTHAQDMTFTPAGDLVLGGWGPLQIYRRV